MMSNLQQWKNFEYIQTSWFFPLEELTYCISFYEVDFQKVVNVIVVLFCLHLKQLFNEQSEF